MAAVSEESVTEDIKRFLKANFPQIEMHGGEASVDEVQIEESHAAVNLAGACSGCGISPQTVQAIKRRLPREIEHISTVDVETEEQPEDEITSGPF